jgi:hypothetical protein
MVLMGEEFKPEGTIDFFRVNVGWRTNADVSETVDKETTVDIINAVNFILLLLLFL